MNKQRTNHLAIFKNATACGISLGFSLLLFSFFESDFNHGFILSFLGIGIIIASMTTFGFGMCLYLMDEITANSRGKNDPPVKDHFYILLKK